MLIEGMESVEVDFGVMTDEDRQKPLHLASLRSLQPRPAFEDKL